jgi:shikimate 5-dehydrogenase/shikimate kinase
MRLVAVAAPPWPTRGAAPPAGADLVEWRLDLLPDADPAGGLATVRSVAQGGAFKGTPRQAAERLRRAIERGAVAVDAEEDVLPHVFGAAGRAGVPVLASAHGTGPVRLAARGPAAWKVARPVTDGASMRRALEEARALAAGAAAGAHPPAFVVPYGPLGRGLRVVTAAIAEGAGADAFVFAAFGEPPEGRDVPEGLAHLPALRELLDDLRLGEVSGRARLFGLVGRPPSPSPSPRLHNAAFRALGLDAVYLPEARVSAETALALPYEGWSVTTPLKEVVGRRCASVEPLAARVGAVNTVVRRRDGRLEGSNTDAEAVAAALAEAGVSGGTALVFGGGGFARAAVGALAAAGLSVRVAGRESAERAAKRLGVPFAGAVPAARAADAVVVNATPLGADGALVPALLPLLEGLGGGALVLDAPYARGGGPAALAAAARARGLACLDGGDLLVRQAAGQVRRFTGRDVDPRVLRLALAPATNLVLVGPRGAGKTTVGRRVASLLGRPFVDTDEVVARREGRPAGAVLALRGEPAFRALERDAVRAAAVRRGAVVALGGGALEDAGSAAAVAEAGVVVRLDVGAREAARRIAADATPRPRLTDAPDLAGEMERLIGAREPALARAAGPRRVATEGRSAAEVADDVAALWLAARAPGCAAGTDFRSP